MRIIEADGKQRRMLMMDALYRSLTPEQQREDRKLRTLQSIVDCAGRRIVTGALTPQQAQALADEVRAAAVRIIPDQMDLYDMIYGSRFQYWIRTFCIPEEKNGMRDDLLKEPE
jgi:hypothetical protein